MTGEKKNSVKPDATKNIRNHPWEKGKKRKLIKFPYPLIFFLGKILISVMKFQQFTTRAKNSLKFII